jgi:hypothetical protein
MTATRATTRDRRPDKSPTRRRAEFAVRSHVRDRPCRFGDVAGTVILARKHLGGLVGLFFVQRFATKDSVWSHSQRWNRLSRPVFEHSIRPRTVVDEGADCHGRCEHARGGGNRRG